MVTQPRRQIREDLEHILYEVKQNSDDNIWAYQQLQQDTEGLYVNKASSKEISDFSDQAHRNAGAHAFILGQKTTSGPAREVDLTYQMTSMLSLLKAESAQRLAFQTPLGFSEGGNRSLLRLGGYDVKRPRPDQQPTRISPDVNLPQYYPGQTHIQASMRLQPGTKITTQEPIQHGVRLVGGVYLGENTYIGKRSHIGPGTILEENTRVGDRTTIQTTILPADYVIPNRSTIRDGDIRQKRSQYTVKRCQPRKEYIGGEQLGVQPVT